MRKHIMKKTGKDEIIHSGAATSTDTSIEKYRLNNRLHNEDIDSSRLGLRNLLETMKEDSKFQSMQLAKARLKHLQEGLLKSPSPKSVHGRFQTALFLFILVFCAISTRLVEANAMHNSELQTGIAQDIIRFHVIANSDSAEDQALKLKVKDTLVEHLAPILDEAASTWEAGSILSEKLEDIQALAEDTIKENGYSYSVKVSLADCYFPVKVYGEYTFPAGYYKALRVMIGAAEGKNWWCVMFPPLCFVDETYSIVDEESGKKLKHLLTEEEYDTLVNKKKPIKIKFKLWESIKDLFR